MFVIHIQTSVTDIQTLVTICYRQNQHETTETTYELRVQNNYPLQCFLPHSAAFPLVPDWESGTQHTLGHIISLHREHASVFKTDN